MANRLKKLADARYTPGTPGQSATPAYCVQVPYTVPGYQPGTTTIVQDENGQIVIQYGTGAYVPPRTAYREVCYPAQPYIAPTPPTTTYTAVLGWNGAARSVDQLDADGYIEFQVNSAPAGVVVGFADQDVSALPSEQTHALYIHGSVVDVLESGAVVHTAALAHTYANVYRITRQGLTVTYSSGAWSYTSAVQSAGAKFIDVSIYASGDFVDNPAIVATVATGSAQGSFARLDGRGYEGPYAEAYGSLQPLSGQAVSIFVTSAAGSLQPLQGVASNYAYDYASGALPALSGEADGGYPEVNLLFGVGTFSSLIGSSVGFTGEVGTVEAALGALGGWASEGPYAEAFGKMAPLQGYADSGWPVPNEKFVGEVLIAGDFYLPAMVASATLSETLTFADEFVYTLVVEDAIYDALLLSDSMTVEQAMEALIQESLLLGNDLSGVLRLELPGGVIAGEPLQYAVNVLTGAITTYSGFGFTSFARSGQDLYGCKGSSVYRVRRGDDDGLPIQGHIDFGASDYGSTGVKSIEAVYLGATTDGQLVARLVADNGDERQYRVVQRGPIMRAVTAKGVGGRIWNVALEIIDASEFELDVLEVQVGISRRWGSR